MRKWELWRKKGSSRFFHQQFYKIQFANRKMGQIRPIHIYFLTPTQKKEEDYIKISVSTKNKRIPEPV